MTSTQMALIVLGGLAVFFACGLALASRIFAVKVDPRVEQIEEVLPGANCGGCGFPGCANYAAAVVSGKAAASACAPGGSAVAVERTATSRRASGDDASGARAV